MAYPPPNDPSGREPQRPPYQPPQQQGPPQQAAPYPGFGDNNVHAQYEQQQRERAAQQAGQPVQRVSPADIMRGRLPGADDPASSPETRAAVEHAQGKVRQRFIALGVLFGVLILLGVVALAGRLM
ncbi:hypothetical protein [Spirillospora sp. NPDC047279]|uniref:hypothetical protein n=1 Tax=Spirillospora sp. NPDC047279 TaxID=3155478 RepID=UPI003403EC04